MTPIAAQARRVQGPESFQPLLQSHLDTHSQQTPLQVSHELFKHQQEGGNRLLRGALIGAAAGLVVCTIISNTFEDEGGFHTCTGKGYLLFSISGAVVGGLVAHFTE